MILQRSKFRWGLNSSFPPISPANIYYMQTTLRESQIERSLEIHQKFIYNSYFIRLMKLSKTELHLLRELTLNKKTIPKIATALRKDKSQIYKIVNSLEDKGLIHYKKKEIQPAQKTHVHLLLTQLANQPSFIDCFTGQSIHLYTKILKPQTITQIIKKTKVKRSTVFYLLKKAKNISLVIKEANKYQLNDHIWPNITRFIKELKVYEKISDNRVPPGSTIYFKNNQEILFSTKANHNAKLTAFSAYKEYGIKLLTNTNYYYLPNKKLTKKDILKHSLYIAKKEKSIRLLMYLSLFYAKFRKTCKINDEILMNINKVLYKQKVKGYPSYEEIKDRAEVYGIKM